MYWKQHDILLNIHTAGVVVVVCFHDLKFCLSSQVKAASCAGVVHATKYLSIKHLCCDTCHKIFFRQQTRNDRDTVDNPEFQNYVDNVHDPVIDPDSIFVIRIHPYAIISPNHNSNMPLTLLKNILKVYT